MHTLNNDYTVWPLNIPFRHLEDLYGKSVVIVLETLPYGDNIGLKKLGSLLIIFSDNWFFEQKSKWHSGYLVKNGFFLKSRNQNSNFGWSFIKKGHFKQNKNGQCCH